MSDKRTSGGSRGAGKAAGSRPVHTRRGRPIGLGKTDWARIRSMSPAEAERNARADPDNPPADAEWLAHAVAERPPAKVSVGLRLDRDVVEWFREGGRGYQTRINAILRAYMEHHRRAGR